MIQVVKTKELKSTTRVEGILVQMSNGEWYGVTRSCPPRSSWYLRGSTSTRTGKLSMNDIFMKRCIGQPDLEEGVEILTRVLNGEEAVNDKMTFNGR
jgi:hypothetical protein